MFTVQLGNTPSQANVVSKEFNVYSQPQGYLRAESSIIDPVIVIECDANDIWRKKCNYAYIEEFGRYYYITNIIAVAGVGDITGYPGPTNLFEFHMHVDVLKSFENEIKAQTAIVARQAATYNLMLDDGTFMCYQNPKIQTKFFSNPTPFETQEFVLIVAGS